MKNKKTIYILVSILAVCLLGVVLSKVINWPVDTSKSSGNIAKTSRFSRKTASDGASNMQELLLNDEEYKNSIVAAYLVMDARANQFNALVDASDEVAGKIPAFSDVLKDMKAAKPMLDNVCAQMKTLASDLDAVLGGETRDDLAQNTTNAALAYNTLQKSNNLATRFIDAADAYLTKNAGDDRLKFVRDQWVDYQSVTAALEQDKKAADAMAEKGHLLSAEKSATALASLGQNVAGVIANASAVNVLICSNVTNYGPKIPSYGASVQEGLGASAQGANLGAAAQGANLGAAAQGANLGASAQGANLGAAAQGANLGAAAQGANLGAAAQGANLGAAAQGANLGAAAQGANLGAAAQGANLGAAAQGANLGAAAQGANLGAAAQGANLGAAAQGANLGAAAQGANLGASAQGANLGASAQGANLGAAAQGANLGAAVQGVLSANVQNAISASVGIVIQSAAQGTVQSNSGVLQFL